MEKVNVNWEQEMAFTASVNGFQIKLDATPEHGGHGEGPTPKPLILVALAGCTGMDIASLSKKMRVEIEKLNIEVEAQKNQEMPIVYTSMTVIYRFTAKESDKDKIIKMVTMSQERYCGVAAMMSKAATVDFKIELNGTFLESV